MIEIIILIVLGLVLGWREVQILCERNSWNFQHFYNVFWHIEYPSRWRNFDSFHVSNGLAVLIIAILCVHSQIVTIFANQNLATFALEVVIIWFWVMYWRNVMMHCLLPKRGYKRLWYLVPLLGGWLENVSKKSTY